LANKQDGRGRSLGSLKNLPQYAGKSDEEILDSLQSKTLATKVQGRIDRLAEEYDFTDMQYHDRLLLERLFSLTIRLEEDEVSLQNAIANSALTPTDALKEEQRLSTMRNDILKIQDSLGISRLKRKSTTEESPLVLFADIRAKAKKFLDARLCQVKCPECKLVISKVNFLYPDMDNRLILTCKKCGTRSEFSSEQLIQLEKENPYK
jgi:RNase P subunit RPR2